MKTYKYLSHTADVRLEIQADTIKELFSVALEGMGNLLKKDFCSQENLTLTQEDFKEKIEISSIDQTALLIDFLSEVLTHSQVNKAIYCKIKIEKLTSNFLSGTIFGNKIESFDEDIKAVTYHEAEIRQDSKGFYETIIVFDI